LIMMKCPKCEAANQDNARKCAICGSVLPVKIVTMEEVLRSRAAAPPGPAKPAAPAQEEGGPALGAVPGEELKTLKTQLEEERAGRIHAEATLEKYMGKISERDNTTERLQVNLERYRKYINKSTLYTAAAVLLASLILIITGFAGQGGLKRELAEVQHYKHMYDSLNTLSRKAIRSRDSLRTELIGLQNRYAATHTEPEQPSAPQEAIRGAAAQPRKAGIDINIEMVPVPGGTFTMGCTAEQGDNCSDDEHPVRSVTVGSFSISKYQVTQDLWKRVMGTNPAYYRGDNLPIERISWREAQQFITKLNGMTGQNYRLPTEAEWEYAARGGASSRGYKFSGSNHIEEVAWYARTSGTTWAGTRKSNELRIHDMSGNVSEWVSDKYGEYGGKPEGDDRVLRGGGWSSVAKSCRVASRASMPPGTRGNNIGFRLAQ